MTLPQDEWGLIKPTSGVILQVSLCQGSLIQGYLYSLIAGDLIGTDIPAQFHFSLEHLTV